MPSDDRALAALELLGRPVETFRSAVAATAEQVRAILGAEDAGADAALDRARAELGAFAAARIDAARFSAPLAAERGLDARARERVRHAHETLRSIQIALDEVLLVDVPPGASLRQAVASRLAELGRAFGAAQAVQLVRHGRYRDAEHERLVRSFPFAWWNRAERRVAPPLVVIVDGADLHAGALAEFVDGAVKIVLVVRGACAPAPLARLVTPGVLVAQAGDLSALRRVASFDGPAVAALVPDGAARFTHDPAAAPALSVEFVPSDVPRHAVGGSSPSQQAEELRQLALLAAAPPPPRATLGSAPAAAQAERLAAWLLEQAGLAGAA
jgi:hypothetical protein